MTSDVAFCPFCRESFEGVARCPSHDLALVSLRELSRTRALPDDQKLPLGSLQRGRGVVLLGAALTLVAFLCPLVRLSGQIQASNTLSELASGRAPRLWLVPAAALAAVSVLVRRRTPVGMRGARLALFFLAVVPASAVSVTLWGAHDAAALMAGRLGAVVQLHMGLGAWLVFLATPLSLWGALRLGVEPSRRVR